MTQRAWQLQAVFIGDGQEVTGSFAGRLLDTEHDAYTVRLHHHNRERWFGLVTGTQSATDWAGNTLTPFRAISGNNTYGTGTAQVFGVDDTPVIPGMTEYDLHRLFVVASSSETVWKLQFIYGSGSMANAIAADQYSTIMLKVDAAAASSPALPVDIRMPQLECGKDKVWCRGWNATNNATIDFFVGIHEYPE